LPEVYAREQILLHENPMRELILQTIRIGDLGIAAIPNEVFALTGLKLKRRSPLPTTFTIELANGGEGYIPPPEQHPLGGYTTWPARSAALVPKAESKIVDELLSMFEGLAGRPRRPSPEAENLYSQVVRAAKPVAYFRLGDMDGVYAANEIDSSKRAPLGDGFALYLDGVPTDGQPAKTTASRAVHLAGGRILAPAPKLGDRYSVEFWFWNGRSDGYESVLLSPANAADAASGVRLTLKGNQASLIDAADASKASTPFDAPARRWIHAVLVQDGSTCRLYFNGKPVGELPLASPTAPDPLSIGGDATPTTRFEGKIDELAIYDRPLTPEVVAAHFQAAAPKADQAR
jgi:hypothetical protein